MYILGYTSRNRNTAHAANSSSDCLSRINNHQHASISAGTTIGSIDLTKGSGAPMHNARPGLVRAAFRARQGVRCARA
jgi:hypothetical protein